MYVKVMRWKVTKGEHRTVIYDECTEQIMYEVKSAELQTCPPDENMETGNMRLVLDVGEPDPKLVYFPWEAPDALTEVYYMNNEGKTIERFVY